MDVFKRKRRKRSSKYLLGNLTIPINDPTAPIDALVEILKEKANYRKITIGPSRPSKKEQGSFDYNLRFFFRKGDNWLMPASWIREINPLDDGRRTYPRFHFYVLYANAKIIEDQHLIILRIQMHQDLTTYMVAHDPSGSVGEMRRLRKIFPPQKKKQSSITNPGLA